MSGAQVRNSYKLFAWAFVIAAFNISHDKVDITDTQHNHPVYQKFSYLAGWQSNPQFKFPGS